MPVYLKEAEVGTDHDLLGFPQAPPASASWR